MILNNGSLTPLSKYTTYTFLKLFSDKNQSVTLKESLPESSLEELESERSSYRQIFKATSLFGGVQVFNILTGIIRVKFVAVLLGAKGVGIIGLLNSPLQLIITITGLGISFSAVRDISAANGTGDKISISKTIRVLRYWAWLTGLAGAVVTVILAPQLSQWSFGNREYTWAFIWLSVTILIQSISKAQSAILQGTRRLREMAKAGVIGSLFGLGTSVPLYYLYGINGIVPALIVTAITGLLLSWYFSRKVPVEKVKLTQDDYNRQGIGMAKLGISMTVAGFIASLSGYILNAFISNNAGVEQVGFYNAGWGVVGQYTAIIFAAMATDYFPRLAAVQADNTKVRNLVNQQIETALFIVTPLLILLIVGMPLVVRILYTPEFLPVVMFAVLTLIGIPFKTISWAMGYVYLAKGDGKLFMIMEIVSGVVILASNLILYYFFGLNGLGLSFIITYFLGVIFSYYVLRKKYDFRMPEKFIRQFSILFVFMILTLATVFIPVNLYRYLAGGLICVTAGIYSAHKLSGLMDLRSLVAEKLWKR
jgi:O-antigen/teichoic acid export membrane protein